MGVNVIIIIFYVYLYINNSTFKYYNTAKTSCVFFMGTFFLSSESWFSHDLTVRQLICCSTLTESIGNEGIQLNSRVTVMLLRTPMTVGQVTRSHWTECLESNIFKGGVDQKVRNPGFSQYAQLSQVIILQSWQICWVNLGIGLQLCWNPYRVLHL